MHNSATVLQISWLTNPFSLSCLCCAFCLESFFIFHTWLVLKHILPSSMLKFSSCVPLFLGVYSFLNPQHNYLLPFLPWHKEATMEFDPCRWLQRCCFVIINTYMKNAKRLHGGSFFKAYMTVQHSSNLLKTLKLMIYCIT